MTDLNWRELPGPWQSEPDRDEWRHRGVPCLMVRNPFGAWCGYVGVPVARAEDPVWQDLGDLTHGGLTYQAPCDEEGKICHVPLPGESDVVWHGFDCGHAWDVQPGLEMVMSGAYQSYRRESYPNRTYRDQAYVRAVCERMADFVADELARPADG